MRACAATGAAPRASLQQARRSRCRLRVAPRLSTCDGRKGQDDEPAETPRSRRDFVLSSTSLAVFLPLASFLSLPGTRPRDLGVQRFGIYQALSLCPPAPGCISTAEELNDPKHFVPSWDYNGQKSLTPRPSIDRQTAMAQLRTAVEKLKPDGWTPAVVRQTDDYMYVEYTSPWLGRVDDVEFWFAPGGSLVEYRSAARPLFLLGTGDGSVSRRRIKALREELQPKGWRSVGF